MRSTLDTRYGIRDTGLCVDYGEIRTWIAYQESKRIQYSAKADISQRYIHSLPYEPTVLAVCDRPLSFMTTWYC